MVQRLHLHTVVIEVGLPRGLSVSLQPEPLEQLADRVVFGDGESHLVPLALLLPLHVCNLSEDDLQQMMWDIYTEATLNTTIALL